MILENEKCHIDIKTDETLTVLQDDTITQIKITDGSIIRHIKMDCFGCNFAIYEV